jgi:hypothetical protein
MDAEQPIQNLAVRKTALDARSPALQMFWSRGWNIQANSIQANAWREHTTSQRALETLKSIACLSMRAKHAPSTEPVHYLISFRQLLDKDAGHGDTFTWMVVGDLLLAT